MYSVCTEWQLEMPLFLYNEIAFSGTEALSSHKSSHSKSPTYQYHPLWISLSSILVTLVLLQYVKGPLDGTLLLVSFQWTWERLYALPPQQEIAPKIIQPAQIKYPILTTWWYCSMIHCSLGMFTLTDGMEYPNDLGHQSNNFFSSIFTFFRNWISLLCIWLSMLWKGTSAQK